ncbi:class I SAM-dependent methyltransferase [Chitinophaga arvensicola]|uniref:Methyltransferase domain-containing protein n=1 Tax=Chitinophaga arvensicola TaxID=29529 RepID=A0A1I0S9W0_9BACT|nr:class I SAM-dependent methyltransferase [Chitinophaga arvensicola]SEW53023.1 Methyltransferase domain-containing protein [Chitinophaga arvensicola]
MSNTANERAVMPKDSSILDSRSLQNSYSTLLPLLHKGMRVLDVGCGTGAISAGIAAVVGEQGTVVGIDSSAHLIAKGKTDHADLTNLILQEADLFAFAPEEKFDLIVSARVLQWLSNPREALVKFRSLLNPGGHISILDYNHTQLEWTPAPPDSMLRFYKAFLDWRADAGMDNEIADHLAAHFEELGFHSIATLNADEVYTRGAPHFAEKAGIWSKVAELRGPQVVEGGFITEAERLQAITEYQAWLDTDAEKMVMKLKDVRAGI